ncbi:Clp protease ClpP [Bradyrhizobium septentrionale]|uniref:ATP-dependent Clp protease proteolytic subunit n=1 Tax=Bradyrhizobium septentrionale TaxID=1404411 RepID=A0A974A344_9BRAD|nr:head maturation protease, ClpP-related [Bradyrhizobium septentrionale]UGY15568.1 Clp protease ClpP [Bradyrhizobium septentrionale]
MPSIARNGEILLSGAVGDGFSGEFFTYLDVVESLASLGRSRDVTVRINSGGGSAADGIAIFNALDSHKGNVTVVVESIAASAASVIAMAGQKIVMRAGSMMMIHDPSALTLGNSSDHAKSVEMLETMANSMADIYAEKRAGAGCLDSAPRDLSGFLPGYAERGALRFCRCVGRA